MDQEGISSDSTENCVFVGGKNVMSYVFAVTTQAQQFNEIRILARGMNISKAVDVEQISLFRFLNGWQEKLVKLSSEIKPMELMTENIENKREERVSSIEIVINN